MVGEMTLSVSQNKVPGNWDRRGLPGWAYSNDELFALEQDLIFRSHWQLACHISDLPNLAPMSLLTWDMSGH